MAPIGDSAIHSILAINPCFHGDNAFADQDRNRHICLAQAIVKREECEEDFNEKAQERLISFFKETMREFFKDPEGMKLKQITPYDIKEPLESYEWGVIVTSSNPDCCFVNLVSLHDDEDCQPTIQEVNFLACLGGVMALYNLKKNVFGEPNKVFVPKLVDKYGRVNTEE